VVDGYTVVGYTVVGPGAVVWVTVCVSSVGPGATDVGCAVVAAVEVDGVVVVDVVGGLDVVDVAALDVLDVLAGDPSSPVSETTA
jgi:hypothetical protein